MSAENAIPAVLFAAKSTEDKHGSIPTQLEDCRAMAAREGRRVVAEFADEAFSAFNGNRGPGLTEALARCEQLAAGHGSCTLIVQHSDRLARGDAKNARHLIEIVLWAIKNDVQLLSVQDREILAGGDLALLLGAIGGMRNHQDSKRKSLAVKSGLRRRAAERGKLAGGPRPYGYRWVGPKGEKELVVVPAEARVVRFIFEWTIDGMTQRAIARRLIDEGIPTVSGKPWCQASVRVILANPLHKGVIRHMGEEFPGVHDGIVSEDQWDSAAAVRASATRRKGGRWPKGDHLLTKGLLRCGRCGYAMVPRVTLNRQKGTHEVYECFGRKQRGVDFCPQLSVLREEVDGAVLAELNRRVDRVATRKRMEARTASNLAAAREALAQAEHEALRKDEALVRIERDYIEGQITAEDWRRFQTTLTAEREGAQEALRRAREHVEKVQLSGAVGDAEETLLRRLEALQQAVAGRVDRAPDLNSLRTTLRQIYQEIQLIRWPENVPPPVGPVCAVATADADGSLHWHDSPVVFSHGHPYEVRFQAAADTIMSDGSYRKIVLDLGEIEYEPFDR